MRPPLTARIALILLAVAAAGSSLALAAEPPRPPETTAAAGGLKPPPAITAVTDGTGAPVPRETSAGAVNPYVEVAKGWPAVRKIRRGQAFWPFEARPPYTPVDQRVEFLGEDEIQVNGVVTINARAPQAALQLIPADLRLDPNLQATQAEGYYLVKIAGFTRTQKEVDALTRAGAVLGEFLNINTYIAKIPFASLSAVRALPFVTAVLDYQPAFKLSPRIGLEPIPESIALDPGTGRLRPWAFQLVFHKGADVDEALRQLAAVGVFAAAEQVVGDDDLKVVVVEAQPEQLIAMARVAGIKWISELGYAEPHASATNPTVIPMLLQNNGAYTTATGVGWKLWNAGIDGNRSGTAQVVTVMDSGLATTNELFAQDTLNVGTLGAAHRKVVGYDVYGGDQCINAELINDGGHGNWVSQHAVGSISNMASNPDTTHVPNGHWDNGIARDAKLYFQDAGLQASGSLSPPLDLSGSILAAIAKGSYIQNHSWGAATPTYDTQPTFLDSALFANPNFVVTASAGNRGAAGGSTIGNICTSKNAICVGGNDAAKPDYLFIDCAWDGVAACSADGDLGSSRGPVAISNRVKPDICTYVGFSATVGGEQMAGILSHQMCQTDATKTVYWDWQNLNFFGGTSFAAPEVAGLAALVRDYFQSGFYPSGSATPADALTPAGSLVKAVILASGEDMATTAWPTSTIAVAKRYSNDVGYGRANLPGVLHVGSGAPFLWVRNNDALGDSATRTFYYNINGNTMPLRVMLVWYDNAGNAIQKDADLKVTVGGKSYWGNDLVNGWGNPSSTLRDHTNNTEGVFLDAAHGLPASGTVQVDVIGYSNPGGMNFSLVVSGDVASQDVVQVSFDKGKYTCLEQARITVNDAGATSPVSVLVTSKDAGGTTIDTETVTCTGANGVFSGAIWTGSGITVADGGTLTATYVGAGAPAVSDLDCNVALADAGFLVQGGCDNTAAGTDPVAGPLSNGGSNEYYNRYMDGGEYTSYTVGFVNQTGVDLSDVYVTLSFSGPGASKMVVFNNPVKIGALPTDGLGGAVFQVYTDPSVAGLTSVDLNFDVTSPLDGYTTPARLTQTRWLQANDQIARQSQCSTFDTALAPWYESAVTCTGCVNNPWRWIGSATSPSTVGSETRTDGQCGSGVANAGAMTGNSATTTAGNFAASADSMLLLKFQPALRGNGPNGQPYHYVWRWHSFYHASEGGGNQGGVWSAFYNDQWNNTVNPTADQARNFPMTLGYYYHTLFDYPSGGTGTWNWDTANGGTPDDPRLGPSSGGAPNQLFINFSSSVTGLATDSTWFSYGHEHADAYFFNGGTHPPRRDIALDNDRLVYDEYYTAAQAGAACGAGGQVGQVAFDRYNYDDCPASTAVVSVLDANAVAPLQVTVVSPGTGDSEVVTLSGTAPYFSGTVVLSTEGGRGTNNGTLFVLPGEQIKATYTDAAPSGTSSAFAYDNCPGGDVVFEAATQVSDNGDNDGIADNNESVVFDVTIHNNMARDLLNTRVRIFPDSTDTIDCASDGEAYYGTVPALASATNPSTDRFTIHVAPSVACSNWQSPPKGRFTVVITADDIYGANLLQTFAIDLDLDATSGSTYTLNQPFDADPGWSTSATPDDDGSCAQNYVNNFHWCAACGNAGAGYGAWIGNAAFGTSGQNYSNYDSSTLYSPSLSANGNVTINFSLAYRTEASYDGALVQYKLDSGAWTTLPFTTPAQSATVAQDYCSPLAKSATAWNGTGVTWTTTSTSTVTAAAGQKIQFRWRLGSDSTGGGTTYGGYGVDNVTITNLQQKQACEPTRNTGLPGCCAAITGLTNNAAADLDALADTGVQVTWAKDPADWGDTGAGTRTYDVLRDGVAIATSLAYGTTSYTDNAGVNGQTYTYAVRYRSGCGSTATTTGVAAADAVCSCPPPDQCHAPGVCDPGTGQCSYANLPNGTTCNDGNACTGGDACQAGVCVGTAPPVPAGASSLTLAGADLSWTAVPNATQYDVVRGGATLLASSGGNFTSSTQACVANDLAATTLTYGTKPAVGDAFWFLVRAVNCSGTSSYDDGTQTGARDAEIALSPNACP